MLWLPPLCDSFSQIGSFPGVLDPFFSLGPGMPLALFMLLVLFLFLYSDQVPSHFSARFSLYERSLSSRINKLPAPSFFFFYWGTFLCPSTSILPSDHSPRNETCLYARSRLSFKSCSPPSKIVPDPQVAFLDPLRFPRVFFLFFFFFFLMPPKSRNPHLCAARTLPQFFLSQHQPRTFLSPPPLFYPLHSPDPSCPLTPSLLGSQDADRRTLWETGNSSPSRVT